LAAAALPWLLPVLLPLVVFALAMRRWLLLVLQVLLLVVLLPVLPMLLLLLLLLLLVIRHQGCLTPDVTIVA